MSCIAVHADGNSGDGSSGHDSRMPASRRRFVRLRLFANSSDPIFWLGLKRAGLTVFWKRSTGREEARSLARSFDHHLFFFIHIFERSQIPP